MKITKPKGVKRFLLNYRKLRASVFLRLLAVVLLIFGLFTPNVINIQRAYANTPYLASDVLGQLDGSSNPDFTTGNINNVAAPNTIGFSSPWSTIVDSVRHRLFVSDASNNRVLVFTLDSTNNITSNVATSVIGQPNFTTNSTALTANGFSAPHNLAYDPTGDRLFVADTNNFRVLVFDTSTITNGMAASNVIGQPNFTTATPSTTQNTMTAPNGLAYDPTNNRLFAADTSSNRVLVFDAGAITNGMNASNVLGQANFTGNAVASTQSGLFSPQAVAYSAAGSRLFVADLLNKRVLVFNTATVTNGMNASNVLGQPNFTTTDVNVTQNGMSPPTDVAYNATENQLYVVDTNNQRVLVFNTAAISDGMNASYVLGQANFTTDAMATVAQNKFNTPIGAGVDSANHRLFVLDTSNSRVLVFDTTTITNGMNANNVYGQTYPSGVPSFTTFANNNQNPSEASLSFPFGPVSIDTVHHRLFVGDSGNARVLVYNLTADNQLTSHSAAYVIGQPDFASPAINTPTRNHVGNAQGTAYDPVHDRLYVSDDNNRIMVFELSNGITNGMDASFVIGQPDFTSSDDGLTQNGLDCPTGITYNATDQRLFAVDTCSSRVLIYDTSALADGMNASYVLGQPDFTTGDPATTQNGMSEPYGITYDEQRHFLFVGDTANNRVLVFDLSGTITNGMNASYVLGQADFTNDANTTTASGMNFPTALVYDNLRSRLFVADTENHRVLTFNLSGTITDGMNASNVLGQPDFTSSASGISNSNLNGPFGLGYDPTKNRLYVNDCTNNRVLMYDFANLTSTIASATINANYSQQMGGQTQGAAQYAVTSGSLPPGLALDADTGLLSGKPTAAGNFTFVIELTDDNGVAGTFADAKTYDLNIAAPTKKKNIITPASVAEPPAETPSANTSSPNPEPTPNTNFGQIPVAVTPATPQEKVVDSFVNVLGGISIAAGCVGIVGLAFYLFRRHQH